MRPTWLAVPLLLTLAACGGEEAANNSAAIDQVLADDNLTGNDLTAIDAVAAADRNMAADIALNELEGESGNDSDAPSGNRSAPAARPARPSAPASEPAVPAAQPAEPTPATTNAD